MKLTTFLAGAVFACTALAQYNITSKPFHLRTVSDDKKYDGTYLFSCHEGAALEALCVGNKNVKSADVYHFNTSYYDVDFNKTLGKTGLLTWELQGANFVEPEPMTLYFDPTTNVALPLFEPTETGTLVAFDHDNRLNIQGYVDDTVVPAKAGPTRAYYRWYVCQTYYTGYRYTTLTWVVGEAPPQNPTCCKVDVERLFI